MSDPAQKTHELQPERNGRVRSNPLFWRSFRSPKKKMKISLAFGNRLPYGVNMKTNMKIDWNKDSNENARLTVNDGVMTSYVSDDQLPDEFTLRAVAEVYASKYDHNGNDESYVVARIEDVTDSDIHTFAFDGNGNFEWDSNRDYLSY